MSNYQVLITGGAGFIGKHTVNVLIKQGFEPIIVDRKPNDCSIDCKYYQIDVTSSELEKIFIENEIKYVIHLAALPSVAESIKNPYLDCMDNYYATVNVCTLAKKYNVEKIIFSSSAAVYANPIYLPVDEKHPTSFLSPYAITKNASEKFIQYSGVNYIIFRYANVYGPGQDCNGEVGVVAKFFDLMSQGKNIEIHGDGEQYRDFIFVEDVAIVNMLAISNNVNNAIINVSTNSKTSINVLFNILKEELSYTKNANYTSSRKGDIAKSVLNNEKLVKLFGYKPKISVENGLKILGSLYNNHKMICK